MCPETETIERQKIDQSTDQPNPLDSKEEIPNDQKEANDDIVSCPEYQEVVRLMSSAIDYQIEKAKKKLAELGSRGASILLEGIRRGEVKPVFAISLLIENKLRLSEDEKIKVLEELLSCDSLHEFEKYESNVTRDLVKKELVRGDRKSSIEAIARNAQITHARIAKSLDDGLKAEEQLRSRSFIFIIDEFRSDLNQLRSFSDREGFQKAEELFAGYRETEAKLTALKGKSKDRLAELLDEKYDADFSKFPEATAEEAASINKAIDQFASADIYRIDDYNHLSGRVTSYGEKAIPFIYQAIKERRLMGVRGFWALREFPGSKTLPIYHQLLLETADSDISFYQKDILGILSAYRDPKTIKVIAEFIRRSAELSLRIKDTDKLMKLNTNIVNGFRSLKNIGSQETKDFGNLLSFIYPELTPIHYQEVIAIPKIIKPESAERKRWQHSKMYIKGSAIMAELLGRGKEKVRDVDVFLTVPDPVAEAQTMQVANIEKIEDLAVVLTKDEYERLKKWLEEHGYAGKKIHLVKVNESQIPVEEVFENEPRLLLWDEEIEDEIKSRGERSGIARLANLLGGREIKDYQEGRRYINADLPERLRPNRSLTRALRLIDIVERFGVEMDNAILEEAETSARKHTLMISDIPVNSLDQNEVGNAVIDPTFIRVFSDKRLRKPLLRRCPRLAQIAEMIEKAGGIREYIGKNYGEIYSQTRGHVRLYDIDLSASPASRERQAEFLEKWYSQPEQAEFDFADVSKRDIGYDLPKLKELAKYVDPEKIEEAEKRRAEKSTFLDRLVGRYELRLGAVSSRDLKEKIELFLSVMNLDWPAENELDEKKVTQTLIRLGVDARNPVLQQFDCSKGHQVDLVISNESVDILGASTDKPWHSCVCVKGNKCETRTSHYPTSTLGDVEGASVIAYLMDNNSFISRIIIRAGYTLKDFKEAAGIEKMYGDLRYHEAFNAALREILKESGIRCDEPMITYQFPTDMYFDYGGGAVTQSGNHYYYLNR